MKVSKYIKKYNFVKYFQYIKNNLMIPEFSVFYCSKKKNPILYLVIIFGERRDHI